MKKTLFTLIILTTLIGCKNEEKSTEKENLTELKGEFIYYEGAAVLQTQSEIYGVIITDKALELDKKTKQYKKELTDMVSVEIKGIITTQKDDKILWEKKLEIVEIINISQVKQDDKTITLGQ